jgi:hypothetical protein
MDEPDDAILGALEDARSELIARRTRAHESGALRARLNAIDLELLSVEEAIRNHCLASGLPLPPYILPIPDYARRFREIATTVLATFLRLLELRRNQRRVAARFGDERVTRAAASAERALREAIRKHCESAGLAMPDILEDDSR